MKVYRELTPEDCEKIEELKLLNLKDEISRTYDFLALISEGGFGKVFKVKSLNSNRIYALKVLKANLLREMNVKKWEETKKRFIQETEILEGCEEKNIIDIFDKGGMDTLPYMVMEFIEGKSLEDLIENKEKLNFNDILKISESILPALGYIHSKGLVHRDIKPGNILIEEIDGRVVLIDFGIAKDVITSNLTKTDSAFGSIHYMSPEQCKKSKDVDLRSDIYSFGAVLFEMVTGEVPFTGGIHQIITQHLNDSVPDVYEKNPDAPPGIQKVIERAMKKKPGQRFQDTGEFLKALRKIGYSIFLAASKQLDDRYIFSGERSTLGLFADVYPIQHRIFKKDCLLKTIDLESALRKIKKTHSLNKPTTELGGRIERFTNKAKFFKKFEHHPNIVDIEDAGFIRVKNETGKYETPYFVVKFIKGTDLKKLIQKEAPLKIDRVINISESILSALFEAHENGYIYWEVIPEKIMIEESSDNAVLISSGLFDDKTTFYETDTGETREYIFKRILNIIHYFPPISDTVERGTIAAICLFGILLYEMLTGELSYSTNFLEDLNKNLSSPYPELKKSHPGLQEGLVSIIKKAIDTNMEKRYGNVKEVLVDLRSFKNVLGK